MHLFILGTIYMLWKLIELSNTFFNYNATFCYLQISVKYDCPFKSKYIKKYSFTSSASQGGLTLMSEKNEFDIC